VPADQKLYTVQRREPRKRFSKHKSGLARWEKVHPKQKEIPDFCERRVGAGLYCGGDEGRQECWAEPVSFTAESSDSFGENPREPQ
jgi:hypothetical protein